ncbi:MAG: diacylglycerol/lipid kinase family protein [Candidatus Acidiferrales bacterium]
MKSATLIYNPVAGRNPIRREREIGEITATLQASGVQCVAARTTASGTATELARSAAASGRDLIIACGGDGTINEVVNGIALGQTPLAILPGGTANIITNELGVRRGPVRAARQLSSWTPRRIALGCATGNALSEGIPPDRMRRYFLGVAGVGFDAYVIKKLTFNFKMSLGVAAYVVEGVRQLMRYSFPNLSCRIDGRHAEASFVLIQRTSRYAGNFRTAPRQALVNSHFGISLFTHRGRLDYVRYALALITGWRLRDVTYLETTRADFDAEPEARVYFELDGELAGTLPATFEVIPDALTLLMP